MTNDPRPSSPPDGTRPLAWALLFILMVLLPLWMLRAVNGVGTIRDVSYSHFKELVESGHVAEVRLRGDAVEGTLRDSASTGVESQAFERFRTRIPAVGDDALLPLLDDNGVDVQVERAAEERHWFTSFLMLAPVFLLVAFFVWNLRQTRNIAGGFGGREGSFLKKGEVGERPSVRFSDVAGQENAKREVSELVDFLREPQRYLKLGAEVPRGVLLTGPPGTGKTLLARALAGEAEVPFFSISGSQFIEIFVGVGASRVRQLFDAAKKSAPSIVFIDELDSVGRTRGTGLGGGHDEREQTLNQILAEMDGFEEREPVIVVAATNRPDVLDPALLRPGRFDRHVVLDLPHRSERRAILEVHTRDVPLESDVDLGRIASGTPGLSGADLKNLVNEAALLAAREQSATVGATELDRARDKILLGTERSLLMQPDEKRRIAVHEAGHTAVAFYLDETDPLYKVSIIPRGRALGGTHQLAEQERHTLPEDYLKNRLAVLLGGRTSEKELLGSVSSGADDDIQQATRLARAMVARWGMSEAVGPVDLRESEEHPFLGREIAQPRRFSESSAQAVDSAVRELLTEAESMAIGVIQEHRVGVKRLVARLEKEETLDRQQIEDCLNPPVSIHGAGHETSTGLG